MSFANINASPSLNRASVIHSPINRINWLVNTFFDAFRQARTEDKEAAIKQLYIVHLDRSSNYSSGHSKNHTSKTKTAQAQMEVFSKEHTRYKFINRQKGGEGRINNRLRMDFVEAFETFSPEARINIISKLNGLLIC